MESSDNDSSDEESLDEQLFNICWYDAVDKVNLLIAQGAHVNYRDKEGYTPLHVACDQSQVNVVKALISHGALVNAFTYPHRSTPLHESARQNNEDIIHLLCQAGAEVNCVNEKGNTPILIACKHECRNVVKALKYYGATKELSSKRLGRVKEILIENADDSLHIAAAYNKKYNDSTIYDGDVSSHNNNKSDVQHITGSVEALYDAVKEEDMVAVSFLLKCGCNVTAQNEKGESALLLAFKTNNKELIQMVSNYIGE